MPDLFAKLDVNYRDDPAIINVGAEAELVYIRSLVLAKRILSDGHIHHAHLAGLTCDIADVVHGEFTGDDYAAALVKADLWITCDDGWIIRTWLEHNQSRAEIDEGRESERTRKAKYRQSKKDTEPSPTDVPPDVTGVSHGTKRHARTVETEKSRDRVEPESETELAPATRSRDVLFDAVVQCWKINTDELTETERSRLNKGIKLLREVDARPEDVVLRRQVYRQKYPDAADTLLAIAGRWAELGSLDDGRPPTLPRGTDATMRGVAAIERGESISDI